MKVYTKVVMDLDGNIIEEESYEHSGPVALCGGGGSQPSGASDYPGYMKNFHQKLLEGNGVVGFNQSMKTLLNAAWMASPYDGESAYDPATTPKKANGTDPDAFSPIELMNTRYETTEIAVGALDPKNDWASFVDKVITKYTSFGDIDFLDSLSTELGNITSVANSIISSLGTANIRNGAKAIATGLPTTDIITAINNLINGAPISSAVSAFENSKSTRFLRSVSRFAGGMADINAVMSSSFIMGLALMESEFQNEIDAYEAQLRLQLYSSLTDAYVKIYGSAAQEMLSTYGQTAMRIALGYVQAQINRTMAKDGFLSQQTNLIAQLQGAKMNLMSDITKMRAEIEKLKVIMLKERDDRNIDLDVRDALWDLEVTAFANNTLGAIAGASTIRTPGSLSTASSALSGALSGAAMGAAIGGGNPIVIGAGALAGGLAGWMQ